MFYAVYSQDLCYTFTAYTIVITLAFLFAEAITGDTPK